MSWKLQNILYNLDRINIVARYISSNFINFINLQRCLIVLFINIFINVFYGLHSGTDFDVNMGLQKTCQKRIVRDDPIIIKSIIRVSGNDLVIYYTSSSICRVFVGINYSRLIKFARDTFCVGQRIVGMLFSYIRRDIIQSVIGAVDYRLFNNYNQRSIRIQLSIKEFSANEIINMLGFREGVVSVDKDDNMCMR